MHTTILTILAPKIPLNSWRRDPSSSGRCQLGSCLGVLFTNFYMSDLKNRIVTTIPNISKCTYCRYVDDIFLAVPDFQTAMNIKQNFEIHSVLNFTYEVEVNKGIVFLNTLVKNNNSHCKHQCLLRSLIQVKLGIIITSIRIDTKYASRKCQVDLT